jgi:hypothetical protein
MFESDAKKGLRRRKHPLSRSIENVSGKINPQKKINSSTVFGELKLTESLYDELARIKSRFDSLKNDLEKAVSERDECRKLVKTMQKKFSINK